MTTAKKRVLCIVILAVIAVIAAVYFMHGHSRSDTQSHLVHKTFVGTVISYQEQTDGSLIFTVDCSTTNGEERFLLTQDTLFADAALEVKISGWETGLSVTVESEFQEQMHNAGDVYPATMIAPAGD